MLPILQVVTVFLTAVAMSLALAHALELPGKLRLDRDTYTAVQAIYYPGFTFGGLGEVLAVLAAFGLLLVTPVDSGAFVPTLASFVALAAMHAAYWVITHPVNRFWLKDQELGALGAGFFGIHAGKDRAGAAGYTEEDLWKRLRNRWEYSHVLRAALAVFALLALTSAVAA